MNANPLSSWNVIFVGALLSAGVIWKHGGRVERFDTVMVQSGASEEAVDTRRDWMNRVFPDIATLEGQGLPASGSFGNAAWEGLELLEGDDELAHACLAELHRWVELGPLAIDVLSLRVEESPADEGWRLLTLEAQGPQAITLATLQHLLAAPGAESGYLSDPARVQLDAIGDELRLDLRVRIWPMRAFVDLKEEA